MTPGLRCFVLGDYVLDEALFELRRGPIRQAVQPKVLQLLVYLAEHRERVVTKEELLRALWPDTRVSAASITRAIRGARIALGDDGESQASIRTVVGRGYQLVREVQVAVEDARVEGGAAQATARALASVPPLAFVSAPPSAGDDLFVGREAALRQLDEQLERALAGDGRCVLLWGEPGIGKTRIAHELGKRAAAVGARVLVGRCMEVEGAPAYWPWVQVLRHAVAQLGASHVRERMGAGAAEIADALPELHELLPAVGRAPAIDDAHARFRLFDSMTSCFLRLALEQPLVLVLDDLQRADAPSLRLLVFLARQLSGARIMIAGTSRPAIEQEQDARDAQVALLLAELSGCDATSSIALAGMTAQDVARYLEHAIGTAAPPAIASAVCEQTGGNALFVRQLVLAFRAERDGDPASGDAIDWQRLSCIAPDLNVRAAIARRLEGLGADCRAMLRTAAVIGREHSASILAHASELPIEHVRKLLADAVQAGLMQAPLQPQARYRFVHALVRDALYEQLSEAERMRLHARIGLALEAQHAQPDAAQLAELAHHFAHATSLHPEQAVRYGLAAARAAASRLAYEEAALNLERTLQLLEPSANDALRCQLLLERGELLLVAEQACEARKALDGAVTLARRLDLLDVLARAALALCSVPETGTVDLDTVRLLEDVLPRMPEADSRRPLLLALHAKALLFSGEGERRFAIAHDALRAARAHAGARVRGEVLRHAHLALSEPHHLDERRALSDELVALARAERDPQLLLHGCLTQAHDCLERGELAGADCAIATMEALASQVRQPYFRYNVALLRATRAILSGQLADAARLAELALELGRRVSEENAWHAYVVQRHALLRFEGKVQEAGEMLRKISAKYPALTGWRAVLAAVDATLGRVDHAREELRRMMDEGLTQAKRDPYVLSAYGPLADLCAMVGDPSSARTLYDALLPHAALNGPVAFDAYNHGPTTRYLAMLATRMKRYDLAEPHFEDALVRTRDLPLFRCAALGDYCDMLARRNQCGDRARAGELLAQSHQLALDTGATGLVLRAQFFAQRWQLSLVP